MSGPNTCLEVFCNLMPENEEARRIVRDLHRVQQCLVSPDGGIVLSHNIYPKRARRLLTFGRGTHNVVVLEGADYSCSQCEIWVHPKSAEILVRDLSGHRTTSLQVDGDVDGIYDFGSRALRQRRVPPHREATLRMVKAVFKFDWSNSPEHEDSVRKALKAFANRITDPSEEMTLCNILDSSLPPTNAPTVFPERILQTRNVSILHESVKRIGHGTFGVVEQCVDVIKGDHYAVKTINRTPVPNMTEEDKRAMLLKEVEFMKKYRHVSLFLIQNLGKDIGRHSTPLSRCPRLAFPADLLLGPHRQVRPRSRIAHR